MSVTKRTVANTAGAVLVGLVAVCALRAMFGQALANSVVGGVLVMAAHEVFNAPVSGLIYEGLQQI